MTYQNRIPAFRKPSLRESLIVIFGLLAGQSIIHFMYIACTYEQAPIFDAQGHFAGFEPIKIAVFVMFEFFAFMGMFSYLLKEKNMKIVSVVCAIAAIYCLIHSLTM